jgi:H+/gluconate symporter-like permease
MLRVITGSSTVAGITTAGIILPLLTQTGVNPNLLALSIGAGSMVLSHVNDAGFWLYKEYFGVSVKDTLRSWTIMETILALVGLAGVLLLDCVV